jgi:hypothetical protein
LRRGRPDDRATTTRPWPVAEIQLIITSLRQLRADAGLHPGDKASGSLTTAGAAAGTRITPSLETITRLAKVTIDAVVVRLAAASAAR